MKTEKLFELLTLVDDVRSNEWSMVMLIADCISKGEADVLEKEWADRFKRDKSEYYPLDLSQIKTWSTYEGDCIKLKFHVDKDKLMCDVKIYDGNSFGGERNALRFSAKLCMPHEFVQNIESSINWAFECYLEQAYENHLEAQKLLWINNLKSQIINGNEKKQ